MLSFRSDEMLQYFLFVVMLTKRTVWSIHGYGILQDQNENGGFVGRYLQLKEILVA